jgi:hypothetical protein
MTTCVVCAIVQDCIDLRTSVRGLGTDRGCSWHVDRIGDACKKAVYDEFVYYRNLLQA